jgi:microtubule-associated protein-like 6
MGQKFGKCRLLPAAEPFARLPKRAVELVWRELNIIAEGFALKEDEFVEICACLARELEETEDDMVKRSCKLFGLLDTDQNGLIDSLEFFGAISAFSGMRHREIFEAIMSCYDFDGTKHLSLDEVVLSLKCVTTGLAKMTMEIPPRESALEELITPLYAASGEDNALFHTERISIIMDFLISNADVDSWFAYFRAPDKAGRSLSSSDFHIAGPKRSALEQNALAWNLTDKYAYDNHEAAEGSWRHGAESLQPLNMANIVHKTQAPDASLKMEWVYGFEAIDVHNSVYYLYQGDVIYTVGRYAVMYSLINDTQRIFTGHKDDITCLAVHPNGKHVATVDCEDNSNLLVWNSTDHSIQYAEKILKSHGASDVVFSLDGKLVCVVSTDIHHTVSVHNWATKEEIMCATVSRARVTCCAFSNESVLVVGGPSYMNFYAKSAEGHHMRKGVVLPHLATENITSLTAIGTGNSMLAGTGSGHLLLMTDVNCVKTVEKAHTAAVTCLFNCRHGILSGGVDAKIRMWSQRLIPGVIVDCSIYAPSPAIQSVCMSTDGSTVLFGTRGALICEVSALDGANIHLGPIVSSHYSGNINAVAVHPMLPLFVTAGDDGIIRIWDMEKRRLVNWKDTESVITSACYGTTTTSEIILVVGYGGEHDKGKCGAFAVYSSKLELTHEAMDATNPVTSVKFSPDSEILAVGFHDGAIFLYAVADEYELFGRCTKHVLPVKQMDYSKDGEFIRSNSLQKDIGFFNADDASVMDNFPSMRDMAWSSFTCLYSWHTKSIHRTPHAGEEVTCASSPAPDSTFIASATNFGYVRLHSFPCVHDDAESHRYAAHTSDVAGMCFTPDKKSFVTVGLKDRCIIQWSCKEFTDLEPEEREDEPTETNDFAFEARDGHQLLPDFAPEHVAMPCTLLQAKPKTKPAAGSWRANVIAPSKAPSHVKAVPDASLHLDHVYGFTTQGMRNNVRYNSAGDLVYPCSRIGVVQKKKVGSQVFFDRHTDKISAFALSRDRKIAATGQHGHRATVAVWDAITGESLRMLPELQSNGTSTLSFSKSSSILAVAGIDDDHTISVYDWQQGVLLSRGCGGGHHLFQIAFSHDGSELLSCGIKDLKIWNVSTKAASFTRPNYGEFTPPHPEEKDWMKTATRKSLSLSFP